MNEKYPASFLYSYVFITGASVMALEMAASRFLAPYYGTSMIVWANIIGLVLLSMSLGYWFGGRLADRRPNGRLLMTISLAAGAATSFLPLWGKLIFPALSAGILHTPVWVIVYSFFAILIVFAPPVFLLAMVSPFAIRLIADDKADVGKAAGNLYAFSTLGSLVGTFGTSFLTIPFLGARESIFLWSAALIAISAWGLKNSRLKWPALILIFLPLLFYILSRGPVTAAAPGEKILWSKDTLYQYVRVVENEKGEVALVYNEGGGVQSLRRPGDALSKDDYYDDYLMLPFFLDRPKNVLVLGSAGGTIPRLMSKYVKPVFPELQLTGVEIDPEVIKLGPRFFGVQPDDAAVYSQDARVFVNNTEERFDIVIVDTYSQQIYIPFHLSTVEFFQTVRNRLTEQGLVALNVNATSADSKLLTSMARTVNHTFPYTYVVKARGQFNYVLIGSRQPLDAGRLKRIDPSGPLEEIRREWPETMEPLHDAELAGGKLLTDNLAPTEMLTDSMIFGAIGRLE